MKVCAGSRVLSGEDGIRVWGDDQIKKSQAIEAIRKTVQVDSFEEGFTEEKSEWWNLYERIEQLDSFEEGFS